MPETNNSEKPSPWIFDLAAILSLVGTSVYLSGWTYAYHYFYRFGLGLLELNIPDQYFLIYGLWIYKAWWWLFIAFYGLSIFFVKKLYILAKTQNYVSHFVRLTQIGIVIAVFFLSCALARKEALDFYETQQSMDFSASPRIRVWTKQTTSKNPLLKRFYKAVPDGEHRLILQNQERLYLIAPPRDGKPARIAVSVIPLANIEAWRVLP